jgi:inosine/xanthosine triphosphate pyrophosphatase family protein
VPRVRVLLAAQLEPESKHRISHRGNALRAAARAWSSLFDGS